MVSKNIFRIVIVLSLVSIVIQSSLFAQSGLKLQDSIMIGGKAKWDFLTIDAQGRRLYASHGDEVDVVDLTTKKVIAQIPAQGSHGIALSEYTHNGFITNGKGNTVTVFDLKDNHVKKAVTVGDDPDAIAFDSTTGRIFAFNAHGNSASVLDAKSGEVIGTIDLKGAPEFAVSDGKGFIYLNLEDKSETLEIDAKQLKVVHRWPLKQGEAPTGLSIDKTNRRLFIGCHNRLMIIMNADNGTIEATLPIGSGVDATAFDPIRMQAYSSNGDGTLTVINENSPDSFSVTENIQTLIGGKTMALDMLTHDIYVASADVKMPLPAQGNKPTFVDGTYKIMKYSH